MGQHTAFPTNEGKNKKKKPYEHCLQNRFVFTTKILKSYCAFQTHAISEVQTNWQCVFAAINHKKRQPINLEILETNKMDWHLVMKSELVFPERSAHMIDSRETRNCPHKVTCFCKALFTQAILVTQLDAIFVVLWITSSFKHVRNFGDIAATKTQVVYMCDFWSCTSEGDKNCIELRDKNRLCKRALKCNNQLQAVKSAEFMIYFFGNKLGTKTINDIPAALWSKLQ